MRITKFTHACVRFAHDAGVLVIDPGGFSEAEALDGADAVLITHEHADHLDVDKLASARSHNPDLRIYAHPEIVAKLGELTEAAQPVEAGHTFTAAGFQVRACGGQHALIHPDVPRVVNLGYLIDDTVYHPGDSVNPSDLPAGAEVETLFLPINAPWLKVAESVDYARAVAPRRAVALHDHLLSPAGAKIYDANLTKLAGTRYTHVEPGTTLP